MLPKIYDGKHASPSCHMMIPPKCEFTGHTDTVSETCTNDSRLEYATSFVGSEGEGISQRIHIDDVTIKSMITLVRDATFAGRAADIRDSTMTYTAVETKAAT